MVRNLRLLRYRDLTLFLVVGLTFFHLWYISNGFLDLAPDEAHYWEWSRRLDLSYYSKGPMVAYLIAVSTRVCGNTEFCVRLPAVLLSMGTATILFLLTQRLFASERAGFLAVLICGAIPLYSAGSILMTIDAPLAFFWALGLYAVAGSLSGGGVQSEEAPKQSRWWLLCGCALGLGLQSKYTMLLFLPCLGGYLILSPQARPWLKKKEPYLGLLLGFLLFTPVIIWNARHDWVSLWHVMAQTGLVGKEVNVPIRTLFDFLGSQIGAVSPLLFFSLIGAMAHSGKLGLRHRSDAHLFLFIFSFPFLTFFFLWSVHEKVQANWAAPAYLAAAVALAGWWDELLNRAGSAWKRYLLAGVFGMVLLPGFLLAAVGHFPDALKWVGIDLPPQVDPTKKLRGWKELGMAVHGIMEETENRSRVLVSDSYQVVSEIAFYVPGQPRVYNINLGRRMNQYDVWGGLDILRGRNLLFVTFGGGEPPPSMQEACHKLEKVEVVKTFHRGRPAQVFSMFTCEQYKGLIFPKEKMTY